MAGERSLIKRMTTRYKELVGEETRRRGDYERARTAYLDAQNKRQMYEQVLEAEGVDLGGIVVDEATNGTHPTPMGTSEEAKPKSNTHAVYLILRRYDPNNAGLPLDKLEEYGKQDYDLKPADIAKVIWRQTSADKTLLERTGDNRIRQTEEGLKFKNFRAQKAEA